MASNRAIGVGAFVIVGVLLFSVALFLVGNRRMLFTETFVVYTELHSLGGLQVGGLVRVAGMNAGEVKDIQVPAGPASPFRIRLEVRSDLRPLVRQDSIATVRSEGLVGAQFIQVSAGSEQSARLSNGGTIRGQEPVEFADLLQQMGDTVRNVNQTVSTLAVQIEQVIQTIGDTATDAHTLIARISDDAERMAESSAAIVEDARVLIDQVERGQGTIGRLFKDDELYRRLSTSVSDAQRTVAAVRQAAEQARDAIDQMSGPKGRVETVAGDLSQTLARTRESMQNLREATDALKHNFLLRGFFNRRGYFSLDEVSPAAYRDGALATQGRRALRIWLRADTLFAAGPDGADVLTDDGRARLDSAMSAFIEFREDGPLIVEGYAPGVDDAARYLTSRGRAAAVQRYLVSRYHLDPGSTGAMALGATPPRGSGQTSWDGVALALFVKPRGQK